MLMLSLFRFAAATIRVVAQSGHLVAGALAEHA